MPEVDMRIIPEPEPSTRTVLAPKSAGLAIKSECGEMTYRCGSCKTKLFEHVDYKHVAAVVVRCGRCGTHNEIPRRRGYCAIFCSTRYDAFEDGGHFRSASAGVGFRKIACGHRSSGDFIPFKAIGPRTPPFEPPRVVRHTA